MINIAISLALWLLIAVLFAIKPVSVTPWATVPFGFVVGLVAFIFLGRKIQEKLELIMAQMQKDISENKIDRAIATLQTGFAFEKRHIFIGAQLNSQIGMLYYIKKDLDKALEHLKKGFMKHYVGQGMLASIYFKRNDFKAMKQTMDATVKTNSKEAFIYGLYAWFHIQLKDKTAAIAILQAGLKKLPGDARLATNLTQLQNDKKLKMKLFGDIWLQFMLERPPRVAQQQQVPPHMRVSRKAMFR